MSPAHAIAPPHPREAQRIATLEMLALLDSQDEPAFDSLVQLAAQLVDVPMAMVSLVDKDRLWFKARHGLDVREVPRDIAFCAHAILDGDQLVLPDLRLDPRFAENPLVAGGPRATFYAGTVIHGPDSLPLGTLCVIDQRPRQLSEEQFASLRHLAGICERLIEARYQELRRARRLAEIERYGAALAQADAERLQLERFLFHDLNGCLTRSGMAAEVLQLDTEADARLGRLADALVSGVGQAVQLVAQLRDMRARQASVLPVHLEPVDLSALVHEAVVAFDPVARASGVTLQSLQTVGPVVRTDPNLVERVLSNVIRNALRYSPQGGRVQIRVDQDADQWRVRITDEGPGVPPELHEQIFEPRVRVGPDAAEPTGEGLGLAFCRLAATAWGGGIYVEAGPAGGASFVLFGPLGG